MHHGPDQLWDVYQQLLRMGVCTEEHHLLCGMKHTHWHTNIGCFLSLSVTSPRCSADLDIDLIRLHKGRIASFIASLRSESFIKLTPPFIRSLIGRHDWSDCYDTQSPQDSIYSFSLEHVKEMRRHVRRTRSSRRPHSWISFPAVRGGRVELRALHVAAGSAAAAGVELLLLLLQQGHIWHGEEKRKKLIHFLMNFIFQTVKRLLLPFFLLQSMEAMFEWEDDEEDKEDKVESSYCCSSLYWCEYTETLILLSVLSGVRAQGLHG